MERPQSLTSYVLVCIQFAIITYFLVITDAASFSPFFLVSLAGVVLGMWAIAVMNFDVNVFPDVREKQVLITNGPYEYIRHPMYTSVLLFTLGLALDNITILGALLWVVLTINLVIKLSFEETLLQNHFKDYKALTSRTKKLIPWVW